MTLNERINANGLLEIDWLLSVSVLPFEILDRVTVVGRLATVVL